MYLLIGKCTFYSFIWTGVFIVTDAVIFLFSHFSSILVCFMLYPEGLLWVFECMFYICKNWIYILLKKKMKINILSLLNMSSAITFNLGAYVGSSSGPPFPQILPSLVVVISSYQIMYETTY